MLLLNDQGQGIAVFSPAATEPWNFGPHGNGDSALASAAPCLHVAPLDRVALGPRSQYRYRYWLAVGTETELATTLDELWQRYQHERAEFKP